MVMPSRHHEIPSVPPIRTKMMVVMMVVLRQLNFVARHVSRPINGLQCGQCIRNRF
jgi:ribosomal protein L34E